MKYNEIHNEINIRKRIDAMFSSRTEKLITPFIRSLKPLLSQHKITKTSIVK